MTNEIRELSPELVLVAPELSQSARAALPDRPWEMFAPAMVLRPPVHARPVAVVHPSREPSTGSAAVGFRRTVVVIAAALVAVGLRDTVRLGPSSTVGEAALELRVRVLPPAIASDSWRVLPRPERHRRAAPTRPAVAPAPPTAVRSTPAGGYFFWANGNLNVDRGGRRLAFTATVRCLGRIEISGVAVSRGGRFAEVRSVGGRRPGTVRLAGSVGPHSVTGAVVASRPGCGSGRVAFVAT